MSTLTADSEREPLLNRNGQSLEVYPVIQMIRRDIMHFIDTPLSYEAMTAPDLVYTLIKPLEDRYNVIQRQGNLSVVFCLLLNRAYFLRDNGLMSSALSRSRAELCELLATRTLKQHAHSMLDLALALTTSWPVYSGADPVLVDRLRKDRDQDESGERVGNAIEIAIIGQAKRFLKSSAAQKVIDGIWSGKIVYQADSSRSILSDTYKRNPIHFYDPHKAPLLDHYRLKVPAVRSVLEYTNFIILFVLFLIALELNTRDSINLYEGAFMFYAFGFTLEKVAAMQEHGITVYFKGTWNGFDLAFITLYCTYAIVRFYGVYNHELWASDLAIDCLAVVAVLVFPRLAFVTLKNNLMVLSLRAMIAQFVVLMLIAVFCFGGFFYALWTLSRTGTGPEFSAGTIGWWMLDLWFGLDASGFQNAELFHPIFGPLMMITYACLSNTLLLTVLVSILSNTFATINEDAQAEAMFRRAVSTIEGVKADSLFSYQPPVNLFALCVLLPLSYILSPRWFHKVNVLFIRLTNFPILLLIAIYERQAKQSRTITFYETVTAAAEKMLDALPRGIKRLTYFEGLMSGSDAEIDAIFELGEDLEELENENALDLHDTGPIPPVEITNRQRRMSQMSRRQVSGPSSLRNLDNARDQQPDPPSSPAAKTEQLPGGLSPLRTRLNSIVGKGLDIASQSAPSPLAQIFQPLVMNDDPPPDLLDPRHQQNLADNFMSNDGPPMVSYGPASRRRLSSMNWHSANATPPANQANLPSSSSSPANTTPRGFPLMGTPGARISLAAHPVSQSPDDAATVQSPEPENTADEIEDNGPGALVVQRLVQMEERQRRMEEILLRLAEKLDK